MAITVECPRCTHEQEIDDDKAGQQVPCKICYSPIKAPGGKPAGKKGEKQEGFKGGPPAPPASKKPAAAKKDEDDDDDERPTPRRRPVKDDSPAGKGIVLIAAGAVVVLTILCGGGGAGAYFLFRSEPKPNDQVAQEDKPAPPKVDKPAPPPPQANNKGNDNVNPPPPPPPPPPMPVKFDAKNPAELERVLAALAGPDDEARPALAWLNETSAEHPRRAEVAKRLEGMVDGFIDRPVGHDDFFAAFFKWAGKDNAPALLRLVDLERNSPSVNRNRHSAMRLLGKLKEPSAVTPIAARLEKNADRQAAVDALIDMGSRAEAAVLKFYHHPDNNTRAAAQKIAQAYNTGTDALIKQCLSDFESSDGKRRGFAMQSLIRTPADPKHKSQVALALNKGLDSNTNFFFNKDLPKVLEVWGTDANVPNLLLVLEGNKAGSREAIRVMGKIREPEAIKAVAGLLRNSGVGNEVRNALKDIGGMAEPAVLEVLADAKDSVTRNNSVRSLGDIGTVKASMPVLKALGEQFPKDAPLRKQIQQAEKAINARAK